MSMFKSFKFRISITFFFLTVFISAFFFANLYTWAVKDQFEDLKLYLKNTAALGASFLSGDEVLKIPLTAGCENDLVRQRMIGELRKITKIDSRIDDAYVMIPGKEGFFLFVANANQEVSPTGCGEPYDVTAYPQMENALETPDVDQEITKDKWGEWLSGYAPVLDSAGHSVGILGLDIAARIIKDLQAVFLERFILTILMALVLALLIGILSSQWLTKPIDQIITGMERVSEGDLNYHFKNLPDTEFKKIALIFNKMTDALKNIMGELARTVKERERISRELEIAADLQQSALPANPPDFEGLDIAAKSVPAKEVGGDYFDFLTLDHDKDRMGFVIADAAGKGFPGTLFMTNSRSVFRVVSAGETVPGDALKRANNFISADASSAKGMFITFLYSVYDGRTKKLVCSNAGHYTPVVFDGKNRVFKTLHAGGLPLGIYPGQDYPEETVQLASGDIVVMYTDGIIEAANSKKDMFSLGRLMKLVEKNAQEPAVVLLHRIEAEIKEFIGAEPQFDDITLIVFKVK